MDKLTGATKNILAGGKGDSKAPAEGEAKQDYGDKAFAAGSKQLGVQQSPETGEKITDGARGAFEKATGQNVPDKVSN